MPEPLSNRQQKVLLAEALDQMRDRYGDGRKRVEQFFAELRDQWQALQQEAGDRARQLEAARREAADLRAELAKARIRIEALDQKAQGAESARRRVEEHTAELQAALQASQKKAGRYDVDMIRHFLDHLLWEVRVLHFESTAAVGTINPELVEQLAKYSRKYHSKGLLIASELYDPDGDLAEAQIDRAADYWGKERAEVATEWIAALESLGVLFEEAFLCAAREDALIRKVRAKDILPPEEGGDPNSPWNKPPTGPDKEG
jgi:hypothetical protein